jgi:hypothetical protein
MTEQFIQFRVKGQKGDENIEVDIGGQLFKFNNIGTSFSNNNIRVPLDPSNPGNVTIKFNNGGSGNYEKIVPATYRRCKRRWGKKRCTGVDNKSYIKKTPWSRMVYVEKFEIKGFDIKNDLVRTVSNCHPEHGKLVQKFNIENGLLEESGDYVIDSSVIKSVLGGDYVERSAYDTEVNRASILEDKNSLCRSSVDILRKTAAENAITIDDLKALVQERGMSIDTLNNKNLNLGKQVAATASAYNETNGHLKIANNQLFESRGNLYRADLQNLQKDAEQYIDVVKENKNLKKENRDRSQTNNTFKQKTLYQQKAEQKFDFYNWIMFYVYYILALLTCVIIYLSDYKRSDFNKKIYTILAFMFGILIYPIVIYDIEIFLLKIFNFIYSMINSKVYNDDIY